MESGRWTIHAALSGISGVVSPRGEVLRRTGLFEGTLLRARVPLARGRTPYDVVGGWLPLVYLLVALGAWAHPRRADPRRAPPPRDPVRAAVVLPTYEERPTIAEVVRGILEAGADAIVVDDSSPDGTADVVRSLASETDRVVLVERPAKSGLASAYRDGFRLALQRGYDVVVEMDADLSHRPADLPALLAGARRHDLTVGSRYVPGGTIRNWSLPRRLLSRGGNAYARRVLGHPVRDATSGFRAFRSGLLQVLLDEGIASDGYGFQIELAYRAWRLGFDVGEVPITFEERRHGASKISRSIVVEALWRVLLWGLRDRLLRRRAAPLGVG